MPSLPSSPKIALTNSIPFAPLSARRLLVLSGIAWILIGMLFGDIFAIFILHQNASNVGSHLAAAARAALVGDSASTLSNFQNVGAFLENRGTKVDTHVHMIAFGYLALMLGVVQPWVAVREIWKKRLAWVFVVGSAVLPIGVFLIHYVGLAYSPLQTIGWASIFADLGGLFVLLASVGYLAGLLKYAVTRHENPFRDDLLNDRSTPSRVLLGGGVFLILLGFLHGSYYAAFDLYRHENLDFTILQKMSASAASQQSVGVDSALADYGRLQGEKAVNIAAHAHIIEFGILAVLLSFFQSFIQLRQRWKIGWAAILLLGGMMLPVCVLLELKYGLLAGGFADFGGFLVIIALIAMWIGILRFTGQLDAERGSGSV